MPHDLRRQSLHDVAQGDGRLMEEQGQAHGDDLGLEVLLQALLPEVGERRRLLCTGEDLAAGLLELEDLLGEVLGVCLVEAGDE